MTAEFSRIVEVRKSLGFYYHVQGGNPSHPFYRHQKFHLATQYLRRVDKFIRLSGNGIDGRLQLFKEYFKPFCFLL